MWNRCDIMRAFVAIPLNEESHNDLARLQDRLRRSRSDVKWVSPTNIHITLKFLGEIDDNQAAAITSLLSEIAKRHGSFNLHINGIGAFPRLAYPKVLWAGIDEGADEVKNLQGEVELSMCGLGFEKEDRTFSPHLTLGRVRSLKNKAKLVTALESEKGFAAQTKVCVDKMMLLQSTLTPQGPIYSPIKEVPLSG